MKKTKLIPCINQDDKADYHKEIDVAKMQQIPKQKTVSYTAVHTYVIVRPIYKI